MIHECHAPVTGICRAAKALVDSPRDAVPVQRSAHVLQGRIEELSSDGCARRIKVSNKRTTKSKKIAKDTFPGEKYLAIVVGLKTGSGFSMSVLYFVWERISRGPVKSRMSAPVKRSTATLWVFFWEAAIGICWIRDRDWMIQGLFEVPFRMFAVCR